MDDYSKSEINIMESKITAALALCHLHNQFDAKKINNNDRFCIYYIFYCHNHLIIIHSVSVGILLDGMLKSLTKRGNSKEDCLKLGYYLLFFTIKLIKIILIINENI